MLVTFVDTARIAENTTTAPILCSFAIRSFYNFAALPLTPHLKFWPGIPRPCGETSVPRSPTSMTPVLPVLATLVA